LAPHPPPPPPHLANKGKRILGHETTAISLVWATHALSIYPDVADRLRTETQDLLATKPDPDYHDLENLPYMDKFTKELFRFISAGKHPHLHPSIPQYPSTTTHQLTNQPNTPTHPQPSSSPAPQPKMSPSSAPSSPRAQT